MFQRIIIDKWFGYINELYNAIMVLYATIKKDILKNKRIQKNYDGTI